MNIAGKGVLLLGVFVAIGIIVLSEGFNDTTGRSESLSIPAVTEESNEETNTTEEETVAEEETATAETESTVPVQEAPVSSSESVLHPPAEVRVLVANGTEVGGAAGTPAMMI